MDFSLKYDEYKNIVDCYFGNVFNSELGDSRLDKAVLYSFFNGGKRFRPVLTVAVADYLSVDLNIVLPYALSLECVHAHSLVHDDLPALDNADTRRNAPSCHVAFDESTAILAGDKLLNFAYSTIFNSKNPIDCKALKTFSNCVLDMLQGQSYDTAYSKGDYSSRRLSQEEVLSIYELKTSALIRAAILVPIILAKRDDLYEDFSTFSCDLGLLFQITDDLLDFNALVDGNCSENADKKFEELNFVSLFGVEKSLKLKLDLVCKCNKICDKYRDFEFLKLLVDFVAERSF